MNRLEEKLTALAAMSPAQLRAEWLRTFRTVAPPLGHRLLALGLAHRLQEKALGGLPLAAARELQALARQLERDGTIRAARVVALKSGTRLVREWGGRTHQVEMLEAGCRYEGESFRSLSEVARRITGTQWSGPRFFGLTGGRAPA